MEQEEKLLRVNAYVGKETKEWLRKYKNEHGKNSYGDVIEELVMMTQHADQNQLVGDILSEEISKRVTDQLKEPLDILRRRTSYSDKQTKVLTEMLNHVISTLKLDRPLDQVMLTTVGKTNTLEASERRIKEQLDHFAQQAATRKAERETSAVNEVNE